MAKLFLVISSRNVYSLGPATRVMYGVQALMQGSTNLINLFRQAIPRACSIYM